MAAMQSPVIQAKKRSRITPFDIINIVLLLFLTFLCLYPLYYTVIASFSDYNAVATGNVLLAPVGFQLTAYQAVFENQQIWIGYRNTLLYTIGGTAFNIFFNNPRCLCHEQKTHARAYIFYLVFLDYYVF